MNGGFVAELLEEGVGVLLLVGLEGLERDGHTPT